MKQKQKAIGLIGLVLSGNLLFIAFSFLVRIVKKWDWPWGYFNFAPADRFMDFFNVNKMASTGSPYLDFRCSYPPLAMLLARFFALFSHYRHTDPLVVRDSAGAIPVYLIFAVFFTALILGFSVIAGFKTIKEKGMRTVWFGLVLVLVFSAPYFYMLDRGNYLIVTVLLMLGFAFFYEKNPTLAAVFLGLATALKLYPAFLFLIFILDKKWKDLFVCIGVALGTSALAMATFKGGLFENTMALVNQLFRFSGIKTSASAGTGAGEAVQEAVTAAPRMDGMPGIYYGVGLTSVLRYPIVVYGGREQIEPGYPAMKFWLVIGVLLVAYTCFKLRKEQAFHKKLLILTALMVFLTPNSTIYNLCYLIPPVFCFILADPEKGKKHTIVYLLILALLMIPNSFWWPDELHMISISVLLDAGALLVLVLYYNLFDSESRVGKKAKITENMI